MSFGKVPIFASYCRRGADSGNYRPIKPPPTSGAVPVRSTSSSGLATPTSTTYQTSHPPLFPASDARYPEHGRNRGKQTENSSDGRLNPASSPDLSFVRLKSLFLLCFPQLIDGIPFPFASFLYSIDSSRYFLSSALPRFIPSSL